MSLFSAFYTSSVGSGVTTSNIYDIFRSHWSSLYKQREKAEQEIDEWKIALINEINDYARRQKDLVQKTYYDQQKYFDTQREEFVETFLIYERKRDTEEMNRLVEKCKNMAGELVKLSFQSKDTQFIVVTLLEPSGSMYNEDRNQSEIANDNKQNLSIQTTEVGPLSTRDSTYNSESDSTLAASNRINQTTTHTNDSNRLHVSDVSDDNLNDQCPVCFMIFPPYISSINRSIHVEKHYEND
ncbi:unnamed protein product [Rotaria magnacalcarata]|uniref:Uncharacterized protein n=2 Tax=Rotaria magnacalcarata TaxID=392030 RepID=A0A816HH20_9BILA|nr:unnamed protein product [Rotaria magnacalcarata]CAF1685775.1 unnamed protein product [Rotaria magnacalcarata]CAF2131544.1 unnamed protein product [Rotaria magnacalcarata]CAF3920055.1 unnamed protein product [Rotaria magnacalcarata]